MTPEQEKELLEKVGKEATEATKKQIAETEAAINKKAEEAAKGLMTKADFDKFKAEELAKVNEQLAEISKHDEAIKEIGNKVEAALEKSNGKQQKSIEQFIIEQADKIKELRSNGKMMEITGAELKAAGVTSIGGSIQDMTTPPGSPYAPGIGGSTLEIFDILRNPNYILGAVDLGRTDQSRLAWANETDYQGAPAEVEEGNEKPMTQHKFQVELSTAKKIAGYVKITDEFDQDLPAFATKVRRMLQDDVVRGWDDAIQAAVIAASTGYTLGGQGVSDANYWDALRFMWAQVVKANFRPNSIGINPVTAARLDTIKNLEGSYSVPAFADMMRRLTTEANKVAVGNAFVGDLKQYKVDQYKDFVLKVGWVNDDLIKNQFTIVGEVRYHRYISDARKTGIVYANLDTVVGLIDNAASS